jgi:long-chain acyl-CoA synthetase
VKTEHLIRLIRERIAATPDRIAMRRPAGREWVGITFRELGARIDAVASWLIAAGVAPVDRVAIVGQNSPEWSVADLAIMSVGAVPVPIYATSTPAQVAHILSDAGAHVAFVGNAEQYAKLAGVRGPGGPLSRVVVFDESAPLDGVDSCHFREALACPVSPEVAARGAAASIHDIATIIYTSGTTGEPKGAVLTFDNLSTQFEAVDAFFRVTTEDRSLCFLPLSHAYERTWTFYVLIKGAQNFYLDDPKRVIDAMREVRPTCMVSVPRLYEKIYATARHRAMHGPGYKRKLFEWAIGVGRDHAYARKDGKTVTPWLAARHALADRLVLHKIRDIVGGPKNFFSAGGAALSPAIEEFFFAAGLLICQGYGLTETSPMLTCNRPNDFRFGTVGKVIPGSQVRIAADGEILARGRNVMAGYFNRPQETIESFEEGWLKTGDIGDFDPDGFLRITDRKKDLIITSGGKNIAPSRIESVIGQDYYIEQVAAVGDGRHYLSALVVPQFEALEEWAREKGYTFESVRAMVKDARIVQFISERIEQQQSVLAHHERVKRFTLLTERFSQVGGEITPTLKNIRAAIAAKYAHLIKEMYELKHEHDLKHEHKRELKHDN